MANFCIPKPIAETLKQAAVRGEFNIAKMYEMTSAERRGLFSKYTGEEMATEINSGFEKAMVSEQQTALKAWAEKVFTPKEKKMGKFRDVIEKIDSLNDMGVLTPENKDAYLSDLVATKLGVTVTSEEAAVISEKANKLSTLADKQSEFGTPTIEWFKARREMENYLDSLMPSSKLKVASSTIGRGTMLFSIKSPLLNIESNTVQGFLSAAERRITNRTLGGLNNEYAVNYIKFVNKVFQESGYDISRMESLATRRAMRGEDVVNSQGGGAVRAVGKFYEDIVFKQLMSAPDVAFSSVHFADSANIMATKIARKEGLAGDALRSRSLSIFKDATAIEPKTIEGQAVRAQAMADAFYATYTNKSKYSDLALGIRKLFNLASGDLRVGDQIMPFVKTPANVIGAGIDASGVVLPFEAVMKMVKTVKAIHEGVPLREAAGENFAGFGRKMTRAGLGLTFAYLLSTLFKPEDFVGAFPVSAKEQELFKLKQATENSVRIGNKWVSLDYFGAIGTPLVGFLYAKKYGNSLPDMVLKYYQGVGKQAAKIPGFDEVYNTIQALKESRPQKNETLTTSLARVGGSVFDFIRARVIPGITSDVANATDPFQRRTNPDKPIEKLQATIPGWRQQLPAKTNIFGENLKTEGWRTMLTGARVKTAGDGVLINELIRLESENSLPALTDPAKTDNGMLLKHQIGDQRFMEAMNNFGKYFKQDLQELIQSDDYRGAPDDGERKKMIDSLKSATFDYILSEYNFEPPEPAEKKKILGK